MADDRLIEFLERWVARCCDMGYARSGSVSRDECRHRIRVRFEMYGGPAFSGEITQSELRMDASRALHIWTQTLERALRRKASGRYSERMRQMIDETTLDRLNGASTATTTATTGETFTLESLRRVRAIMDASPIRDDYVWMRTGLVTGMSLLGWLDEPRNEAAETRAKDLFRAVAGTEAFNTLDAEKPLPIKGSTGTRYTLHRRSTFCVERESDGARLCVVVPGVPMWDHLLGVKLMVENDEPKFLATANVVPGPYGRAPAESFLWDATDAIRTARRQQANAQRQREEFRRQEQSRSRVIGSILDDPLRW